jgi:propanediol dehydratase small subunit
MQVGVSELSQGVTQPRRTRLCCHAESQGGERDNILLGTILLGTPSQRSNRVTAAALDIQADVAHAF